VPSHRPLPQVETIDHVVGNLEEGHLNFWAQWYQSTFDLRVIKEYLVDTKESSLRTIIVSNDSRSIKMPLLEPVKNVKKSQNQEYLEFNNGPGVQHIALLTSDIIHTVSQLRARGVKFQEVPPEYYTYIKQKLQTSNVQLKEDFAKLQELKILIDFDDIDDNKKNDDTKQNSAGNRTECGYLLQIFTHLVQDRPTVFFEIIQRHNHEGFGEGNIRALFECVEREQAKRGNLV
jgi:4-hydroxyphenylpyruvate dioxygenase